MKNIILFAALTLISSLASAEMYKCKTAEGRIVYSEQPCADNAAPVRNVAPPPSEQDTAAAHARLATDINHANEIERSETKTGQYQYQYQYQYQPQPNYRPPVTTYIPRQTVTITPVNGVQNPAVQTPKPAAQIKAYPPQGAAPLK